MFNRTLHIVLTVVLWCGIAAYIAWASTNATHKTDEVKIDSLRVVISDGDRLTSVTEPMVREWVARSGVKYKGESVGDVNIAELHQFISKRVLVRQARVYTDLNGILTVEVSQYQPIARVKMSSGYDFYITSDAHILPPSTSYAVHVPVITGNLSFMMPTGYYGDYEQIKERLIEEYRTAAGRLDSIEMSHRNSLTELKNSRSELKKERPGKLWGKQRRQLWEENRSCNLAELDNKIESRQKLIDQTRQKREDLDEKQKKSAKRYIYLYKLLNFVKFVENDDFWKAQIVQINIVREEGHIAPIVEIAPRAGRHTVCLGSIDQAEANLQKLMLFYHEALAWEGWDGYNYIDLRYEDQIVCSK